MKFLFVLLVLCSFMFAEHSQMTPSEHRKVHAINQKPLVQRATRQNMHKIHHIDEKKATEIVKDEFNENIKRMKLHHRGKILFYDILTENYHIKINSLNGEIISSKRIEK